MEIKILNKTHFIYYIPNFFRAGLETFGEIRIDMGRSR